MTEKQKKLLFSSVFPAFAIVVPSLLGFFIYAGRTSSLAFFLIAIAQAALIAILFVLRRNFLAERTALQLQKEEYHETKNLLAVAIAKEQKAKASSEDKVLGYAKLRVMAECLSLCATGAEAVDILAAEVSRLFSARRGTVLVYLFHPKTGEFGIGSAKKAGASVNIKAKTGDLFDRWVIKNLQPLLVEDIKTDFRFDGERKASEDDPRERRSLMAVPLNVGNKVLGILRVDSPLENGFSTEDLRFLSTVSDLGAVAIDSAQLYERIQDLAIRDSLTGLYLRRYLLERMDQELLRQLRRKDELSLLMIDLDHFKTYNDKHGHIAGDMVLKTVSGTLSEKFNHPGQIICRYGGEEFVVFLPDCPKGQALALAEDLRKTVEAREILLRREKTTVTVSVGVATFPQDAQLKEELIARADEALYQAKRQGRNRVCLA